MTEFVGLIAGATGAVGTALAQELSRSHQWEVYGLSRRNPINPIAGVDYRQLDLSDRDQCTRVLSTLPQVTHLFYCGRATHAEQLVENIEDNVRLLRHLVDTVQHHSKDLRHVHLVQGGKYYGVHVGPFPTPACEEDQRVPIANFNYDQQDFLTERAIDSEWTWSASRPNTLLHYSPGNARNLVSTLGAYAAICRALGTALDFPGSEGAFNSLTQVTTIDVLSRGIRWMSTDQDCANQAFNLTNTDLFRWRDFWPLLADAFGLPMGTVRPMKLSETMADRGEIWQLLRSQHDLVDLPLEQVANWSFADATLERYWDEILCHNKVRKFGFHDWDNSQDRFFSLLQQYRDTRVLPN